MSQHDAVIVGAVRTPVGVGKPGKALSGVHPGDLSAHVLAGLVERTGVDPALVDDVIWGCVSQVGEQGVNIGRNAALAAGFPESVPGTTVDRQCGSSQQAVHFAAAGLVAGHYDVVIAGGVESMSRVPMFSNMVGGDGPFPPADARPLRQRTRRPGHLGRDDRREVGAVADPARRDRGALARARGRRHRHGAVRRGDPAGGRRRHRRGHPARHHARDASRACGRRSRRTASSRPATPRRSPTGRPRCCSPRRRRPRSSGSDRSPGSTRSRWPA